MQFTKETAAAAGRKGHANRSEAARRGWARRNDPTRLARQALCRTLRTGEAPGAGKLAMQWLEKMGELRRGASSPADIAIEYIDKIAAELLPPVAGADRSDRSDIAGEAAAAPDKWARELLPPVRRHGGATEPALAPAPVDKIPESTQPPSPEPPGRFEERQDRAVADALARLEERRKQEAARRADSGLA